MRAGLPRVFTLRPAPPDASNARRAPADAGLDDLAWCRRLQRVLGIQEALEARMGSTHARAPGTGPLSALIGRWERGEVDPNRTTDLLDRAALRLEPALDCDDPSDKAIDRAARRLLRRSPQEIDAIFGDALQEIPVGRTRTASPAARKTLAGLRIVGEIARGLERSPKLQRFIQRLSFAPPFAFGEVFAGRDPKAAVKRIESADADTLDGLIRMLDMYGAAYLDISETLGARSKRGSLLSQREQTVRYFASRFGVDAEDVRAEMRNRQRLAAKMAADTRARALALYGDRAKRALERFDMNAEIITLADPRAGLRVIAALEETTFMRAKARALFDRMEKAVVVELGRELMDAIRTDRDLRGLPEALEGATTPVLSFVGATLFSQYRCGTDVRATLGRLREDWARETAAFTIDLKELVGVGRDVEAAVREARRQRSAREAERRAGAMSIDQSTKDAIIADFRARHPAEAIAYVIGEGRSEEPFFVKSTIASKHPLMADIMCQDDPADLERLARITEKTGLMLMAKAHSHPFQPAAPLTDDIEVMRTLEALVPELRTIIVSGSVMAAYEDRRQVRLELRS
jgi:hypothetical protein